jgi:predicted Na+-dependent transporter
MFPKYRLIRFLHIVFSPGCAASNSSALLTSAESCFPISKRDTIAICFCAPAKSVGVGAPLIGVMWGAGFSNSVQSLVMVPIVLYQAEQILCGQLAVILFRRWARGEWIPGLDTSDEETVRVSRSGADEAPREA